MKAVAIIPARGGSKGVPGKNIRPLNGKMLINHSIDFAFSTGSFDRVVVSTDDFEISEKAKKTGAEVIMRPDYLAKDDSLVIDAIRHIIKSLNKENYFPDILILLEPTSPIRMKEDVFKAIDSIKKGHKSAATFCLVDPAPTRLWKIENNYISPVIEGANPFLPRQQQSVGYKLTGQIYAFKPQEILNSESGSIITDDVFPIITNPDKVIDIDTEMDFILAEQILKYYEKN